MQDDLKFTVSGGDLQRLMKAHSIHFTDSTFTSELDSLTDAQVDLYADDFYKYNANALIQEIDAAGGGCSNCGGVGASTYAYAYGSSQPGWPAEVVQTRADGSTVTTFDNIQRQTILQDVWNGLSGSASQHSITYNVYDGYGNLTAAYQPSATTPYTFSNGVLTENPSTSTGLVDVYQYYSSLTAPEYPTDGTNPSSGGGVPGYPELTGLQQGSNGSPVWQSMTDYVQKTVGGNVVYYPYDSTQFADTTYDPNDGTGGSPRTTTDHYTFLTGTSVLAVASMTIVQPVVPTSQNGSGMAATSQVVYDTQGRVVWTMDANGSIGYTQYDPQTGGVVERIQDVNTSDTGDFTNLPSGWSNTAGKELLTSYAVDSLGRTTKQTDPDGDVTYTVYNDANHEVRTYPGWHQDGSGNWQPTGPVYDVRDDTTGNYSESLTYFWDNPANLQGSTYLNGDGSPKGAESVTNANVTIRSLSRSLLDPTGQVSSTLEYVNFNGTSYSTTTAAFGTWGTNYIETDYSYDALGRAESAITPAGALSFTVYNGLGQASDQWAGTTTATSSSARTTIINNFRTWVHNSANQGALTYSASGVNLYKTTHIDYDTDGYVVDEKAYFDPTGASNPRITYYGYDWRDRQTYAVTVNPANSSGYVYTMTTYDNLDEVTETQQYQYVGSQLATDLANATADPPQPLNSGDTLLAQSTSLYDPLGQVYQASTYQVANGAVIQNETQTSNYWYDPNGNQVALEDPDGNGTLWAYNGLGQQTQSTQGQIEGASGPWTFNNLALPTASGQSRTLQLYGYFASAASSLPSYTLSDPNATFTPSGVSVPTGGWYNLGTICLPSGDNSTSLTLTQNGGTTPNEICLGFGEQFSYYADGQTGAGQLYEQIDRDGRATVYQYDTIGRETSETSYATSTLQNPTETISYTYNAAGWLQSAMDTIGSSSVSDAYTAYDMAGDVTTETQTLPGLTPMVILSDVYNNGERTQLAANIGGTINSMTGQLNSGTGTNDFANNYAYQGVLGQMSQVTQQANGGNSVAAKTATFQYDLQGEFTYVNRYQSQTTSNLVAQAAYQYDADGDMTSLAYTSSGSTLPSYSWTYDRLDNMATESETIGALVNESVSYANDSTGQLGSATGTGGPPNESYSYDTNGNRTNTGYATGPNNELLTDGAYTYAYDANGNRVSRTAADGSQVLYTWDNRNRLTSVTFKNSGGTVTQTVAYIYDAFNRWIAETITPTGGTIAQTRFVYDGNQIVVQFDGTGSGALTAANLSHRYLWSPAVDQLLADEQLQGTAQVVWTLGDNQDTVRDLATYNSGTGVTTVVNHRVFSAYAQLESETIPGGGSATVGCLFAYTGRPLDKATGLQNNLNRWYDAITGRWLSQDPIGFYGGDVNLYTYVGNTPNGWADPSGLLAQQLPPGTVTPPPGPTGQGRYGYGVFIDQDNAGHADGWYYYSNGWFWQDGKGCMHKADPQRPPPKNAGKHGLNPYPSPVSSPPKSYGPQLPPPGQQPRPWPTPPPPQTPTPPPPGTPPKYPSPVLRLPKRWQAPTAPTAPTTEIP